MSKIAHICSENADYNELLIQTCEQVCLKVIAIIPKISTQHPSLVFVGGLSTIIESFHEMVYNLSDKYPFYFIETRDHASSQIAGDVDFSIQNSGEDIVAIVNELGLTQHNYILMGYSMGATIVTDCYSKLQSKPLKVVLFQPVPVFHYPKWGVAFIRFVIRINLKPYPGIAKWYLRNFVINKKEDAEMVKISEKAMDNSDPDKLRKTAVAISDYSGWDKPVEIDCPVLILIASKDSMHNYNDIMKMISLLKNCTYLDLETNKRTHSREAALIVSGFIEKE